jgi:hypothetical protein
MSRVHGYIRAAPKIDTYYMFIIRFALSMTTMHANFVCYQIITCRSILLMVATIHHPG